MAVKGPAQSWAPRETQGRAAAVCSDIHYRPAGGSVVDSVGQWCVAGAARARPRWASLRDADGGGADDTFRAHLEIESVCQVERVQRQAFQAEGTAGAVWPGALAEYSLFEAREVA